MISFLLFALAAFFNSVMDTSADHFSTSVLKMLDPQWWNKEKSRRNQYIDRDDSNPKNFQGKYFPFFFDAWHSAKTLMISCLILSVWTYRPVFGAWDLLILIACWGGVFNLFYGKVLVRE